MNFDTKCFVKVLTNGSHFVCRPAERGAIHIGDVMNLQSPQNATRYELS